MVISRAIVVLRVNLSRTDHCGLGVKSLRNRCVKFNLRYCFAEMFYEAWMDDWMVRENCDKASHYHTNDVNITLIFLLFLCLGPRYHWNVGGGIVWFEGCCFCVIVGGNNRGATIKIYSSANSVLIVMQLLFINFYFDNFYNVVDGAYGTSLSLSLSL